MNSPKPSSPVEAESTLRLIASLPAPVGLETRVKAALRSAPSAPSTLLSWPLVSRRNGLGSRWMDHPWMKSAAAAAIVALVAGGSFAVYSRMPKAAFVAMPRVGASGGFSSAGAIRTPKTLDGPVLARPAANHDSAAPSHGMAAAQKRPNSAKKPLESATENGSAPVSK